MLTGIKVEARDVFLPLLVRADDLQAALRLCARYFNPRLGDGILRVEDEQGHVRVLRCRYAGGLEGNGRDGGYGWQKIGIRLRALSPYWEAENPKNYVFAMQPPVLFFQSPFFPLRISRGSIDGLVTVQNDGDVEAYPIITATGPLTSLEVQNLTSGKTLNFPVLSMTAGDVLVVDARPDALRVTLDGANAWGLLTATSSLWSVGTGANQLKIITTGTDSNSSVTMSFFEQYLTV
ncbi:MAG: hypothetical protein WHV44_00240 [Anaerolineales bacterium]